jgi:hypothetical protein
MPFGISMKNTTQIGEIVSKMLTAPQKKVLELGEINDLVTSVSKNDILRFNAQIKLCQKLDETCERFDDFCKAVINLANDNELKVSKKEIIPLVYRMTAGNFYKCIKAGAIPPKIAEKFEIACNEAEKDGLKFARSIEALNSWFKKYDEHKGECGADAESIADLRDGADKRTAVWSISLGDKKCTMFDDKSFKTNFTETEINDFLNQILTPTIRTQFATKPEITKEQKEVLNKVAKNKAVKLNKDLVLTTA